MMSSITNIAGFYWSTSCPGMGSWQCSAMLSCLLWNYNNDMPFFKLYSWKKKLFRVRICPLQGACKQENKLSFYKNRKLYGCQMLSNITHIAGYSVNIMHRYGVLTNFSNVVMLYGIILYYKIIPHLLAIQLKREICSEVRFVFLNQEGGAWERAQVAFLWKKEAERLPNVTHAHCRMFICQNHAHV